jgi:two-component system, NtrC family, nitrogen regulation sensor histidine kinase NtrY
MKTPRLTHEQRFTLIVLAASLPGILSTLLLLMWGNYPVKLKWPLILFLFLAWPWFTIQIRKRMSLPLQAIANFLAALREGDFSLRAHIETPRGELAEVYREVNALGNTLQEQRLGAMEATALLRTVMNEIEVAVFTFDEQRRLKLINRAGEKLLAAPAERLLEKTAAELGLAECLEGDPQKAVQLTFPGGMGRWGIRRTHFREHGRPHELLVMADLSRALREEERQAWQRLIRVLGHELNNSLTPVKSMAGSMESLLKKDPLPADWLEDMQRGLSIIGSRAESLSRFMEGYTRLAKLPQPCLQAMQVAPWVKRVAQLEVRMSVTVRPGPDLTIQADPDQLEQLLINLLRNAVDASLATNGKVTLSWQRTGLFLEVTVEDEGPGVANPSNIFVPFFTTKPGGSGIGLVLSRQIAEGHEGSLVLENRQPGPGCTARLRIPLGGDLDKMPAQ